MIVLLFSQGCSAFKALKEKVNSRDNRTNTKSSVRKEPRYPSELYYNLNEYERSQINPIYKNYDKCKEERSRKIFRVNN
jgi:hypothetical protein